ncbi:MAG: hypothetical protein ACXVB0_24650 [Mucilaginibacter sp.]
MHRRRKRTNRVNKLFKQVKVIWIVKAILYTLGIYSFIYAEHQHSLTLISTTTPIVIGIVSGLTVSLILERNYKYYLFSIIFWGSIFTAVFFKLNTIFASRDELKLKQHILYKALESAKIDYSRVTINYDGYNKDVGIASDQESIIGSSAFVILTVKKGGLGYFIITDTELAKK